MTRRPAHKLAHAQCPYGVFNWSDCDAASSHRWGRCTALVDRKAGPGDCTNWAVAEDGYCGQHFIARYEKDRDAARKAARTLQLNASIDAFLSLTVGNPTQWLERLSTSAASTRGLQGIDPPTPQRVRASVVGGNPSLPRKGPHRLTELA